MLFAVTWQSRAGASEESQKRSLALFQQWEAPDGVEFQGFWDYSDGTGGLALVETNTAGLMMETIAPWTVFFDFEVKPIVPVEEAVPIVQGAIAWRDSAGG